MLQHRLRLRSVSGDAVLFDGKTVFLKNFAQKNAVYALETCKSIPAAAVVLETLLTRCWPPSFHCPSAIQDGKNLPGMMVEIDGSGGDIAAFFLLEHA